jgi:2-haloacid dehalogenase
VSGAVTSADVKAVVFDIGGVLVDWDPRHLYRAYFDGDEALMEHFLENVCTPAWNVEQDRGRPWDEAVALLTAEYPECRELIRAYRERWEDMVSDTIAGVPDIVWELKERGVPLYLLTNCAVDTFGLMRARFDVFSAFDGAVVSGAEGLLKPDPALFRRLIERFALDPAATLLIDDVPVNVAGAEAVGLRAHHFTGAAGLRSALEGMGVL